MAILSLGLFAFLFYWRLVVVRDLDVLATVFWILWPDLGAFVPIGLAMRGGRSWPDWGAHLYDVFHTFLGWGAVFALWSIVTGAVPWPLLGRALHISADRAVGYSLRARGP